MRFSLQKHVSWRFCGQRQRCQSVHYEIYPQHLNGSKNLLFPDRRADKSTPNRDDVYRQLELQEFSHTIVYIPAPEYGLYDRREVILQKNYFGALPSKFGSTFAHREPNISLF